MPIKVYNTLSKKKEDFVPVTPGKINMYVCGVTVYDHCHLGHARALVCFDLIYRYFQFRSFDVTFVRNFTDVDDKIINKANAEKISCDEVTSKYISSFYEDMTSLGIKQPTIEPRGTEHMAEIIQMIQVLIEKGIAYEVEGDVFYAVRKKSDYGKLSGKKIDELEAGARIEIMDSKTDPLDFALWKSSKPNEPSWDSPWGKGRPGWHIECSAMSLRYLGSPFDIHGGGRDLSFPHHENEIAQSESYSGKDFANYWIHNGFVNVNHEKMSKSLGNFLTIKELIKRYHPEVLRAFILSAHYRSPLDYTEEQMQSTRQTLLRWYSTCQRIQAYQANAAGINEAEELAQKVMGLRENFIQAMDDDFNSAMVVGFLFDLVREWNKAMDDNKKISSRVCETFFSTISEIHSIFGLFGSNPDEYIHHDKQMSLGSSEMGSQEIEDLLEQRRQARKNKDFKLSDSIRDELAKKGIQIKDNPDGTTSWTM